MTPLGGLSRAASLAPSIRGSAKARDARGHARDRTAARRATETHEAHPRRCDRRHGRTDRRTRARADRRCDARLLDRPHRRTRCTRRAADDGTRGGAPAARARAIARRGATTTSAQAREAGPSRELGWHVEHAEVVVLQGLLEQPAMWQLVHPFRSHLPQGHRLRLLSPWNSRCRYHCVANRASTSSSARGVSSVSLAAVSSASLTSPAPPARGQSRALTMMSPPARIRGVTGTRQPPRPTRAADPAAACACAPST